MHSSTLCTFHNYFKPPGIYDPLIEMWENIMRQIIGISRQTRNIKPKRIRISDDKDGGRIDLYHLVDSVHLKPMTQIDVVLRLR